MEHEAKGPTAKRGSNAALILSKQQRRGTACASAKLMVLVVILCAVWQPVEAQLGTASLSGMVTDPTGAGIPNAVVSLESMTRKAVRKTVTDAVGSYVFTSLLPDTYQLVAAGNGFATKTTQNIELTSGQG